MAEINSCHSGTYYHVLITYDGTTIKMYRDGILIKTDPNGTGNIGPNTYSLKIGRTEDGYYFNAVEEAYKIARKRLKTITGKEKPGFLRW